MQVTSLLPWLGRLGAIIPALTWKIYQEYTERQDLKLCMNRRGSDSLNESGKKVSNKKGRCPRTSAPILRLVRRDYQIDWVGSHRAAHQARVVPSCNQWLSWKLSRDSTGLPLTRTACFVSHYLIHDKYLCVKFSNSNIMKCVISSHACNMK